MGPISLGLGHNVISVRPITQLGETDFGNRLTKELVRQSRWDRFALSVGPKHSKGKQRVCNAISVGLIAHLGWTETLRREIEKLQSHLGETEIPIGRTDLPRVLAVAMTLELNGTG